MTFDDSHSQIFNIFTSNGTVMPMKPGKPLAPGQQAQVPEIAGAAAGEEAAAGETIEVGAQTGANASVTAQVHVIYPGGMGTTKGHPGIYHGSFVYNRAIPYYIPPLTYNPHIIARNKEFLNKQGFARVSK